jgi:hypothetical protein
VVISITSHTFQWILSFKREGKAFNVYAGLTGALMPVVLPESAMARHDK